VLYTVNKEEDKYQKKNKEEDRDSDKPQDEELLIYAGSF